MESTTKRRKNGEILSKVNFSYSELSFLIVGLHGVRESGRTYSRRGIFNRTAVEKNRLKIFLLAARVCVCECLWFFLQTFYFTAFLLRRSCWVTQRESEWDDWTECIDEFFFFPSRLIFFSWKWEKGREMERQRS